MEEHLKNERQATNHSLHLTLRHPSCGYGYLTLKFNKVENQNSNQKRWSNVVTQSSAQSKPQFGDGQPFVPMNNLRVYFPSAQHGQPQILSLKPGLKDITSNLAFKQRTKTVTKNPEAVRTLRKLTVSVPFLTSKSSL